jgi:hypothetical protein
MEGLPKIAKGRMLRRQGSQAHPDAGMLTAFLEQALAEGERDQVLSHLAVCPECRDVARLASPQPEAMQPVLALPAARRRWSRPGLWQWGAAAAAVVVVTSAVVVMQPRLDRGSSEMTASSPMPAEPERLNEGSRAEVARSVVEPGRDARPQAPASVAVAAAKPAPALASAPAASGERETRAGPGEEHANAVAAGSKDAAADAQPATPEPATKAQTQRLGALGVTSGLSGSLREVPRDQIVVTKPELKAGNAAPPTDRPTAADERAEATVSNRDAALAYSPRAEKQDKAAFGLPANSDEAITRSKRPVQAAGATEWRIADDGQLQRLRRTPAPSWNTVKVGSEKLQILAFRGPEIWVGGRKGRLYKSLDNGMTWVRVKGSWSRDFTIVGLSFQDDAHGELRLENGELWVSRDGGSTWSRH